MLRISASRRSLLASMDDARSATSSDGAPHPVGHHQGTGRPADARHHPHSLTYATTLSRYGFRSRSSRDPHSRHSTDVIRSPPPVGHSPDTKPKLTEDPLPRC